MMMTSTSGRISLRPPQHLRAVHPRHAQVGQDDAEVGIGAQLLQARFAVVGRLGLETGPREDAPAGLGHVGVVLDDEDLCPRVRPRLRDSGGMALAGKGELAVSRYPGTESAS